MKYMKLIWGFVLFIATLDMQYGYYQFIRLASAVFFVYYAFFYFKDNKTVLGTLFTGLAILFQPFSSLNLINRFGILSILFSEVS